MPQETHQVPLDFVYKSIGRLLLETQYQLEQMSQRIGELQQKLVQEQQKRLETEAKLRDLESRLTN